MPPVVLAAVCAAARRGVLMDWVSELVSTTPMCSNAVRVPFHGPLNSFRWKTVEGRLCACTDTHDELHKWIGCLAEWWGIARFYAWTAIDCRAAVCLTQERYSPPRMAASTT